MYIIKWKQNKDHELSKLSQLSSGNGRPATTTIKTIIITSTSLQCNGTGSFPPDSASDLQKKKKKTLEKNEKYSRKIFLQNWQSIVLSKNNKYFQNSQL